MPRQRLREAVKALKPYRQGDLDTLCGLYSIINAIQLTLYPRRLLRRERDMLFRRGLGELHRRRCLKSTLSDGMPHRLWLHLCHMLVDAASALTGESLALVTPPSRSIRTTEQAIRTIRQYIRRGRPVFIELQGRLDHWTVVVDVSDKRMAFFDSSGHRWIQLRSVGLIQGMAKPSHGIFATRIVALRKVRRRKVSALASSCVDIFEYPQ